MDNSVGERNTEWRAKEVELDYNEDPSKNRVYATPDQELVITKFEPGDSSIAYVHMPSMPYLNMNFITFKFVTTRIGLKTLYFLSNCETYM